MHTQGCLRDGWFWECVLIAFVLVWAVMGFCYGCIFCLFICCCVGYFPLELLLVALIGVVRGLVVFFIFVGLCFLSVFLCDVGFVRALILHRL